MVGPQPTKRPNTGVATTTSSRDGRAVAWYNGHRGYRDHRHGYRNYNGFRFPAGAFGAGAIIGGALADERLLRRRLRPALLSVTATRAAPMSSGATTSYRSYRAYDNTFQPYHGPRQQCYSLRLRPSRFRGEDCRGHCGARPISIGFSQIQAWPEDRRAHAWRQRPAGRRQPRRNTRSASPYRARVAGYGISSQHEQVVPLRCDAGPSI